MFQAFSTKDTLAHLTFMHSLPHPEPATPRQAPPSELPHAIEDASKQAHAGLPLFMMAHLEALITSYEPCSTRSEKSEVVCWLIG